MRFRLLRPSCVGSVQIQQFIAQQSQPLCPMPKVSSLPDAIMLSMHHVTHNNLLLCTDAHADCTSGRARSSAAKGAKVRSGMYRRPVWTATSCPDPAYGSSDLLKWGLCSHHDVRLRDSFNDRCQWIHMALFGSDANGYISRPVQFREALSAAAGGGWQKPHNVVQPHSGFWQCGAC